MTLRNISIYRKKLRYRIQQWHLRYFGHVMRMNISRYLKTALLGGEHGISGSSKKCWTDSIKEDFGTLDMIITQASRTAQDKSIGELL